MTNKEAAQALKDCPFCGGKTYNKMGYDYGKVSCDNSNCKISGVAFYPDEWNTRAEALTDHGKAEGAYLDPYISRGMMEALLPQPSAMERRGVDCKYWLEIYKIERVIQENFDAFLAKAKEHNALDGLKASQTPQTVDVQSLKKIVPDESEETAYFWTVHGYNQAVDDLASRGLLGTVGEWRDISTAPKDGTNILAFYKENHGDSIVIAHFDEATWAWWTDGGLDLYVDTPSEWMPLPASPQPKPQNEKVEQMGTCFCTGACHATGRCPNNKEPFTMADITQRSIAMGSNQGWECPKCGRVYSPVTLECFKCNNGVTNFTVTAQNEKG